MLRVMGMEFAKTGLGEQECKANGIDYKTTTVESRSHARYYPDPVTLTVKLTYRAADKVLLGAQIAGAKEAAVRIDTFACAVDQGMTTDELGFLDLGYAPPFASVWTQLQLRPTPPNKRSGAWKKQNTLGRAAAWLRYSR